MFEYVVREEVPNSKPIWLCKVCNFQALRKNHTVEHFLYKHAPDENLPCDYCGKIFNKRPTLRKHLIKCKRKYAAAGQPQPAAPNVTIANPLLAGSRHSTPMLGVTAPNVTIASVPNPLLVGSAVSQAPPPNVTISNPLLAGPAARSVPRQELDPNATLTHVPNPLLQ